MRRRLVISAFLVVLLGNPIWAQKSNWSGFSMGGPAQNGLAWQGAPGVGAGPLFPGAANGWNWRGWNYGHHDAPHFRHCPWRWDCASAYGFPVIWFPLWNTFLGPADANSDPPPARPASDTAPPPDDTSAYLQNSQLQQDEINRLHQEVDRLQDEERGAQDPQDLQNTASLQPYETLLVFRDQHTEEIQNYVLVGKMLWIFNELLFRKIPVASLDLAATVKANEERGIDLHLPD